MFSTSRKLPADRQRSSLSYIGAEAVITGGLVSPATFQIDGRVEGDVHCHALVQGHSGAILGNIAADEVRLAGLVDGTVSALTVMLDASARITGDVSCETLSIETGAQVEGRFVCKAGAVPVPEDRLRDSPIDPPRLDDRVAMTSGLFATSRIAAGAE
jgi:cytoskeletal protein CcmA (bactofilin family)